MQRLNRLSTMGLVETLSVVTEQNQRLSTLAFSSSWGNMNRRNMVAVLEKVVTALNEMLVSTQTLSVLCAQEKMTNYVEPNVKRIQEALQYFERNVQFEKSVSQKSEETKSENETFVALQEKLQWLVSNIRHGVEKTQTQLPRLIGNQPKPILSNAASSVVMNLHQKELELIELKDKLQRLQFEKIASSVSNNQKVDQEQTVYDLAKKVEYYLTNLKQTSLRKSSLLEQLNVQNQELDQYTKLMEEQLPKLLSECFAVISQLKQEHESLQKNQLELLNQLQTTREENARQVIRLQELALNSQKTAEEKVRAEKKTIMNELQQKSELLNHFQKKYHEHEQQISDLMQQITQLKHHARAKTTEEHNPKEHARKTKK